MRRCVAALVVIALAVVGLIGAVHTPTGVFGQTASPSTEEEVPPGVSFAFIATGQLPPDLEAPASMSMFHITVDPGAVLPVDASDPTTAMAYVEQGDATFQVDAEITVLHASADQETTGADFEPMPAQTEFTMSVGDSAVFPGHTGGTLRNDGTEPVVLLIAQLEPAGTSEFIPGTPADMGTPSS